MSREFKSHPLTKLLARGRRDLNELDNDPKVQLRIHTLGFYYWSINFPLIIALYLFDRPLWNSVGLFITLIYSIYANWTSDYTGMSSSQSVINTSKDVQINTTGDVSVSKKEEA